MAMTQEPIHWSYLAIMSVAYVIEGYVRGLFHLSWRSEIHKIQSSILMNAHLYLQDFVVQNRIQPGKLT